MNIEDHLDTDEFKKAFWHWFDNLPVEEKRVFYYYRSDMAELNFFNTVYRKTLT